MELGSLDLTNVALVISALGNLLAVTVPLISRRMEVSLEVRTKRHTAIILCIEEIIKEVEEYGEEVAMHVLRMEMNRESEVFHDEVTNFKWKRELDAKSSILNARCSSAGVDPSQFLMHLNKYFFVTSQKYRLPENDKKAKAAEITAEKILFLNAAAELMTKINRKFGFSG
ncbi:MAG: hypothetical protein RIG84_00265 [Roseovarius sp.]